MKNATVGESEEFEPTEIVPRRIGFCTNWITSRSICGRQIDDQDIEAVELPQIGRQRQFVCGPCVERLLSPKPIIDLPDKVKNKKYGPGHHVRLPKGPPR